jgi:hypothetical protein
MRKKWERPGTDFLHIVLISVCKKRWFVLSCVTNMKPHWHWSERSCNYGRTRCLPGICCQQQSVKRQNIKKEQCLSSCPSSSLRHPLSSRAFHFVLFGHGLRMRIVIQHCKDSEILHCLNWHIFKINNWQWNPNVSETRWGKESDEVGSRSKGIDDWRSPTLVFFSFRK